MANEMPWNAFQGNDKLQPHPLDQSLPGGVVVNPHSAYAQELKKWNTPKRYGGMNVDGYEEYPRTLYKAIDFGTGKAEVHRMPPPRWAYPSGTEGDKQWDLACLNAEQITKQCQATVHNDTEKANYLSRGWTLTQDEALEAYEKQQQTIGDAAAERVFRDQRMSEKARAEADAADKATHAHVPDVPAPKKRRGRKPKAPMVTV